MARIRSTHPQQWTDDAFVCCSPLARLLALGLRNEADDNSIFEWNPTKLKMRLLPADNCDLPALLAELVEHNLIWHYRVNGRELGMIRSFQRFQKPKSPTFQYPIPSEELPKDYELHPSQQEKSEPQKSANFPTPSPPLPKNLRMLHAEGEERRGEGETPPQKSTAVVRSAPAREEPPGAAALLALFERERVRIDAKARLHASQWAKEGVAFDLIASAIAFAREKKPHPAVIPIAFVISLLPDVEAGHWTPAEKRGKAAAEAVMARLDAEDRETAWWEDPTSVVDKGKELGLAPVPGEDLWSSFAPKVFEAAGPGPWQAGNVSHAG